MRSKHMAKDKKIVESEYKAFLEEIKSKINAHINLFGEEGLNIEQMADEYERLNFSDNSGTKKSYHSKKDKHN